MSGELRDREAVDLDPDARVVVSPSGDVLHRPDPSDPTLPSCSGAGEWIVVEAAELAGDRPPCRRCWSSDPPACPLCGGSVHNNLAAHLQECSAR